MNHFRLYSKEKTGWYARGKIKKHRELDGWIGKSGNWKRWNREEKKKN